VGHPLGPELGDEDLDPHLLMWDVHRNIDLDAVPRWLKLSAFRKTVKRLITGTVVLLFAEVSERHRNS
jgi:hypothetical protein